MTVRVLDLDLGFRDAKGWVGRMRFHIGGDAGTNTLDDYGSCAATLITAVEALTNATIQSAIGPALANQFTLAFGSNSQYPAEWMKAVYTFSTDTAQISRFKVPAPKLAQFTTDGITVDNGGSNAIVDAFVSAVKTADASGTFVSTQAGVPYTHFEGGILRLGKQPRRFNGRIKSAQLVAGEGE